MKADFYGVFVGCLLQVVTYYPAIAQKHWMPQLVQMDKNGQLVYKADDKGNTIPDFSRVGYRQHQEPIPYVPVVKVLEPGGNNDQAAIQAAIDSISQLPLGANGFRGAIYLKKGVYKIPGTIQVYNSGIVLRGEGSKTHLIASGKKKRDLIHVAGKGNIQEVKNTRKAITQQFVPVGAMSFTVADTHNLQVGDRIILLRPGTKEWISDLQMDKITPAANTRQWQPQEYDLHFERYITDIRGNRIFIDNPVVMEIDIKYGGGFIYKYTQTGRIENVGIEDLYCESAYESEEDEEHGWVAVSMNRVENCWITNVTALHFGYSCVHLGDQSKQVTVNNCRNLAPKSIITGGRRYSFNNDGQLNLFMNCFASEGRHDYVTGAKVCGPNVFYNCRSVNAKADIGPHHRWACGTLYDNIITDGEINVQDRGNWGTGHGWSGVTQVIWNCRAARAAIQNPWVSGKNYAIGLYAQKYSGRLKGRPDGIWDGHNRPGMAISSLYTIQLAAYRRQMASPVEQKVYTLLGKDMLAEARWAMRQRPVTITSAIAPNSLGGLHDFYSEGDYWWPDPQHPDSPYIRKDGISNPNNFIKHRDLLIRFSRIVAALACGYKMTGDLIYAAAIQRHCNAWFVDASTRMNPSLLYAQAIKGRVSGRGIGIIDAIHLMEVVKGIETVEESGAIEPDLLNKYKQWFKDYLTWVTTHPYGLEEKEAKNNHGTCWVMQVALFAKFTNQRQWLWYCEDRFRNVLLPQQMALDGSFPLELARTKPYGYSLFNLDAMATICQILSAKEKSLWNFCLPDGRSVKKAVAFLYPYIINKANWPFKKDVMHWEDWPVAQPALVFAANAYHDQELLKIWELENHTPEKYEVIRNLPVRHPYLWF